MRSKRSLRQRTVDGRVIALDDPTPAPYLRAAELMAGLHLGFTRATGRLPRLHALGLGTPILLPLLAALGSRRTFTATDSTAPIKDAWIEATTSLYVATPAPRKLKAHRIAEYWLDGVPWGCACPHCVAFCDAHPPQLQEARAWWASQGRRRIEKADLRSASPLSAWLPLLSNPKDPALRERSGLARVAHNHWVLGRLQRSARRAALLGRGALHDWAQEQVEAYVRVGTSPYWARGVRTAWDVVSNAAAELRDAKPSGVLRATRGKGSMSESTSLRRANDFEVKLARRSAQTRAHLRTAAADAGSWATLARTGNDYTQALLDSWTIEGIGRANEACSESFVALANATAALMQRRVIAGKPGQVQRLGRALAVSCHVGVHEAYALGYESESAGTTALTSALAQAEDAYFRSLRRLRRAAIDGDKQEVAAVLTDVAERAGRTLAGLAEHAAALPDEVQASRDAPGLRVSILARRYAMLAAACVVVHARLCNKRTLRTTGEIARRRNRISRRDVEPARALCHLNDRMLGRTVSVLGFVAGISWIERPDKPYGTATLRGRPLRIPFKSLTRQGVSAGAAVCVTGRVKEDSTLGIALEVEGEGPTSHEGEVWEDWLAVQVRDLYDLYPGSLRMQWAFPSAGARGGRMDLLARVAERLTQTGAADDTEANDG
jgi:hypothetical protein